MNMKSKKKDEIIAEYEDLLKELRSTQRLCRLNAEQAIKDFDEYKNVLGQINFYATRLRTGQYQSRDDVNADIEAIIQLTGALKTDDSFPADAIGGHDDE